jgi:hypothetical protein
MPNSHTINRNFIKYCADYFKSGGTTVPYLRRKIREEVFYFPLSAHSKPTGYDWEEKKSVSRSIGNAGTLEKYGTRIHATLFSAIRDFGVTYCDMTSYVNSFDEPQHARKTFHDQINELLSALACKDIEFYYIWYMIGERWEFLRCGGNDTYAKCREVIGFIRRGTHSHHIGTTPVCQTCMGKFHIKQKRQEEREHNKQGHDEKDAEIQQIEQQFQITNNRRGKRRSYKTELHNLEQKYDKFDARMNFLSENLYCLIQDRGQELNLQYVPRYSMKKVFGAPVKQRILPLPFIEKENTFDGVVVPYLHHRDEKYMVFQTETYYGPRECISQGTWNNRCKWDEEKLQQLGQLFNSRQNYQITDRDYPFRCWNFSPHGRYEMDHESIQKCHYWGKWESNKNHFLDKEYQWDLGLYDYARWNCFRMMRLPVQAIIKHSNSLEERYCLGLWASNHKQNTIDKKSPRTFASKWEFAFIFGNQHLHPRARSTIKGNKIVDEYMPNFPKFCLGDIFTKGKLWCCGMLGDCRFDPKEMVIPKIYYMIWIIQQILNKYANHLPARNFLVGAGMGQYLLAC